MPEDAKLTFLGITLFSVFAVLLGLPSSVLLHELGHIVMCRLLGFRVLSLSVLPVVLYRTDNSWKLTWTGKLGLSGSVGCCPVGEHHLRLKVFGLTAAGPFASFLSGVAFARLATNGDSAWFHSLTDWLSATALFSFLCGIGSLLPRNTPSGPSDGLWMWIAIRWNKDKDTELACWLLKASSIGGLRPKEWNPSLVKIALSGSTPNAQSRWLEYNWYADTKQLPEAAAVLEWWLQQDLSRVERAIWWYEAAWFEAFSMSNLAAARERLKIGESFGSDKVLECSAWKARAAIAAGEGRCTEAANAAHRAQDAISHLPLDRGLTKGIREDLSELLAADDTAQASSS
jgi:hypothetical protein